MDGQTRVKNITFPHPSDAVSKKLDVTQYRSVEYITCNLNTGARMGISGSGGTELSCYTFGPKNISSNHFKFKPHFN